MKTRLPFGLVLVAILQFVAPLVLPPATLKTVGPVIWAGVAVVFALLGVNLLRRQSWSRVATVFVQGFNIIVRILVIMPGAVIGDKPGAVDVALVGTSLLSMALSAVILYYVDLPDVQVIMQ